MRNALRSIVILGVLSVFDAVVFVPVFATAQAVKPTNKIACCIPGNPPTCGQLTADNCSKHGGTSLGAVSCSHNPCSGATTTTTTGAATTTTSSAAPTTTTSSAAPTTTTSSAAPTTTTSSAAPTTTTSSAAPTTTTSSAAPT